MFYLHKKPSAGCDQNNKKFQTEASYPENTVFACENLCACSWHWTHNTSTRRERKRPFTAIGTAMFVLIMTTNFKVWTNPLHPCLWVLSIQLKNTQLSTQLRTCTEACTQGKEKYMLWRYWKRKGKGTFCSRHACAATLELGTQYADIFFLPSPTSLSRNRLMDDWRKSVRRFFCKLLLPWKP